MLNLHSCIFLFVLAAFIILRFYQLEDRMQFTWDQIQNSWVMKDMIMDHKFPLEGMVAKGNSGFYIGPAYYYFLVPFYYLWHLDPIASGIFAGSVSLISFFVLYLVSAKIFSKNVALISVSIATVSYFITIYDHIAWPVLFVPVISILIFYFLYLSITDNTRNLLYLGLVTGFSFHFHFTSIFYPMIIFFAMPLFIRKKHAVKYSLLALPLFAVWFIPNIIAGMTNDVHAGNNLAKYIGTYFHGFHLVRFRQLLNDAFIVYESILHFKELRLLAIVILPVFSIVYGRSYPLVKSRVLIYLFSLWFIVPWVVFTTYSGEISNYYFLLSQPMVIMSLAFLTYELLRNKFVVLRIVTLCFWFYYAFINVQDFIKENNRTLPLAREAVNKAVEAGEVISFGEGDPKSYLYYVQTHKFR